MYLLCENCRKYTRLSQFNSQIIKSKRVCTVCGVRAKVSKRFKTNSIIKQCCTFVTFQKCVKIDFEQNSTKILKERRLTAQELYILFFHRWLVDYAQYTLKK